MYIYIFLFLYLILYTLISVAMILFQTHTKFVIFNVIHENKNKFYDNTSITVTIEIQGGIY